ncbi:hypothetical protein [Amaricoccus sp.]|uniref:hypothetical protein n=1 Tax=Amaricoccus sp. TaxID=1872485 RepID=UPI001B547E8A|nr:hypothetical protein [Amaricoccus sp.]MBP7000626.1 hypothetical protein [Amaricoccus sp.]
MPAPIPLAPLAWTAIRIGAVAAVAFYTARGKSQPKHAHREAVLDELPEGLIAEPHRAEAERAVHGAGRFRRTFRLRPGGPGVEVDAAALGRFRMRRVE